ncbi:hypothetical protein ACIG3E_15415 [Streptomyces sp. NPDC053474]|uniref:hypothetical protein n=1 Tax=Streptomyces sp. NPDC053474 TaxID=3365704 RepID=UPI0037CD68F5
MTKSWVWAGLALAGAAGGVLLLAGPEDGGGSRLVSAEEAQRMALARFRTYQGSPSEVVVRVPAPEGAAVVRAVVDHRRHRAVGWYQAGGQREPGLLAWDGGGLAVAEPRQTPQRPGPRQAPQPPRQSAGSAARAAARLEPSAWTRRPFGRAPLDAALRLTLAMAADRPENPQLLAQSGPLHLRTEQIDGHRYDVLSGPRPRPHASASTTAPTKPTAAGRSPLTYWIGGDGELRRITADFGADRTVSIDLTRTRVRPGVPDTPWKPRPAAQ